MKKSEDIIGLPLISIDEATDLGEIKDILIDPHEGKVKYFLIMDAKWYLGAKIISFDKVLSIGDDAITIQGQKDLKKFCEAEDAYRLAEKDIRIINTKAFTEKGQCIGNIKEYYISEKDGTICGCLMDDHTGSRMVEYPKIISFGTKALVMEEPMEVTAEGNSLEGTQIQNSALLFEEKQRQFLIGRKAKRQLLDGQGNVLLEEGQTITKEILDRIKDKNKIIELTINTR